MRPYNKSASSAESVGSGMCLFYKRFIRRVRETPFMAAEPYHRTHSMTHRSARDDLRAI